MKNYLAIITWEHPYPKEFQYRVRGSNIAVAVGSAVRQFRKENKGKRVNELKIRITKL